MNFHVKFADKFIAIGEDHVGKYGLSFKDKKHTSQLRDFLANKKQVTCWFEGPPNSRGSTSFNNFINDFKQWARLEKLNLDISKKGWEATLKFKRADELTTLLIGMAREDYEDLIIHTGQSIDGKKSLLECLIKSKRLKGSQSSPPTESEAIEFLSEGSKPSDILMAMYEPCTKKLLKRVYGDGNIDGLRDQYFYGQANAKTSSSIYKRIDNFNSARDKHLAKMMKTEGGIFLAGDSHIEFLDKFL